MAPDTSSTLLTEYGGWQGETRRKHRGLALERLGWRLCGAGERKLLDEFLLARALEHDAPRRPATSGLRLATRRIDRPPTGRQPDSSDRHGTRRGTSRDLPQARAAAATTAADAAGRPARRRPRPRHHPAGVAAPQRHRRHARAAQGRAT
jgi:hypothetical protein